MDTNKTKKVWKTPTITLLDKGYVVSKTFIQVHENTGHYSLHQTPSSKYSNFSNAADTFGINITVHGNRVGNKTQAVS